MKIGFVGLGVMGLPIAERLCETGHRLAVNDLFLTEGRKPLPSGLAERGVMAVASLRLLAAENDLVITMLRDTPDVEAALFGDDGIGAGLVPGKIFLDLSSIDPLATAGFAARVTALGAAYVDAPASGGPAAARAGRLKILCGAAPGDFSTLQPLFENIAAVIRHVGPVGAGQTAKVAHQIVVALTLEAVAEGLHFVARAGHDPAPVREALMQGYGNSRILDVQGGRMLRRAFEEPGFPLSLQQKDLEIALAAARHLGLTLPGTEAVHGLIESCLARGAGQLDHAVILTELERLAGPAAGK